ncbi:glycosyltransferase family 2 protein [Natrinema limicola]|nr:glycosyltransferase family 2 protein [Natrinema limicola]
MSKVSDQPLVSVIIPMHNESDNIELTLSTLQKQTYDNIQLIIVDDCSDDNSFKIAENCIGDINGDHLLLENQTNLGQSFSRNRGAMHADGKYIVFHDADDLSTPDRLTKQVEFLEANPTVGVVGGAYFYINPNRNQCEVKVRPTDDESIRSGMARECMINLGTAMFRREALFETSIFKSYNVEGYELIVNVGKNWSFANLRDPIYLYQINKGSRSQQKQLKKKVIIAYRSYQAIKKLDLSYWNLPLQIGWLIYMTAPNPVKTMIRKLFSPTKERPLSEDEKDLIRKLTDYQ